MTRLYIVVLAILTCSSAFAQYTKLRDFGAQPQGVNPYAAPVSDGTYLYGVTLTGGDNSSGTIYKLDFAGNITIMHQFDGTLGYGSYGGLLLDGTVLYGMSLTGGTNNNGYVYKINTDGSGFTDVFDFDYGVTGGYPYGGLISDGTSLYGLTSGGGSGGYGTIFKINKDGSGFVKMFEFFASSVNKNGGSSYGSLAYDGTYLYGATQFGGINDRGVLFKIKTDGTGYSKLVDFNGTGNGGGASNTTYYDGTYIWMMTTYGGANNTGVLFRVLPDGTNFTKFIDFSTTTGQQPTGSLISDGTYLYGSTSTSGPLFGGNIFRINPDGSGFTKLVDLDYGPGGSNPTGTPLLVGSTLYLVRPDGGTDYQGRVEQINTDGSNVKTLYSFSTEGDEPSGGLVSDGTYLYGLNTVSGEFSNGSVFRVKPDGTDFKNLVDLDASIGSRGYGGLYYEGSKLYGMTSSGGANNKGTVFSLNADGTGLTTLVVFDGSNNGDTPRGGLISDGTYLYGTTQTGGANNNGTIFKVKPDGTGYTKMHDFASSGDGLYPSGTLLLDGSVLYGFTYRGGDVDGGTIFSINTDGTNYNMIKQFEYIDGTNPMGIPYSDGTYLYGLTSSGGDLFTGTIFRVKKDGSSYEVLQQIDQNIDYGNQGAFVSDGTYLYAMSYSTLFKIKPDGSGYAKMMDLTDVGSNFPSTLYLEDGFLYGVTDRGGKYNHGSLFKRSTAPSPEITSFDPQYGSVGLYLTIDGTEFDPDSSKNVVTFSGGAKGKVVKGNASELTVIVPKGSVTGPISITTAGITGISTSDFNVEDEPYMDNVKVQTCDLVFQSAGGDDDLLMTFEPSIPGAKITIDFTSLDTEEELRIYNGPSDTSAVVGDLVYPDSTFSYTSTAKNGELTVGYYWEDEGTTFEAKIGCFIPTMITQQPVDKTACDDSITTLTVVVQSSNSINYQWQYSINDDNWDDLSDDAIYSGTNKAQLKVTVTNDDIEGYYRCLMTIVNTNGLVIGSDAAFLTYAVSPEAPSATNPDAVCIPSAVTLKATGGTDGQYHWYYLADPNDTDPTEISGQSNGTLVTGPLTASTTYYVTNDNGTCESAKVPIDVTVNPCDLVIYNAVSPNSDGKNDVFYLEYIDTIPTKKDNVVKIYNRWGEEVFSVVNYNNQDKVFTGLNKNGNKLPSGTYYYKISFTGPGGGDDLTGYLELKY